MKHGKLRDSWIHDPCVKVVQSLELRFMMIHVNGTTTNYYRSTKFLICLVPHSTYQGLLEAMKFDASQVL